MNKLFGPLIGLGLVGLLVFFAVTDGSSVETDQFFATGELTDVQEGDFVQGSGDVQIIEYGDFECPACEAFYPVANQIKTDYPTDVTFVFRHLPLSNIHPRAMAAHRAAEAAALQGKFFEMHDILYENQFEWNSRATANLTGALEIIEGFAEDIGLDMDKYRTDVNSQAVLDNIKVHLESASQLGANSTPTVFVNGEKLNRVPVPNPGAGYTEEQAIEDMKVIVENALAGRDLESAVSDDAGSLESTEDASAGDEEAIDSPEDVSAETEN